MVKEFIINIIGVEMIWNGISQYCKFNLTFLNYLTDVTKSWLIVDKYVGPERFILTILIRIVMMDVSIVLNKFYIEELVQCKMVNIS